MQCCPYLHPLRILSRKWSFPVLRTLQRPLPFSELQRELRYATSRVLVRELRELERFGLVGRVNESYALTDSGYSLMNAVRVLGQWGVQNGGCRSCPVSKDCSECEVFRYALNSSCLRPPRPGA